MAEKRVDHVLTLLCNGKEKMAQQKVLKHLMPKKQVMSTAMRKGVVNAFDGIMHVLVQCLLSIVLC